MGFQATFVHTYAKLGQKNLTRMVRCDDTAHQTVWGRARYLWVTEAHNNTESLRVSGNETLCFFETCMAERRTNLWSPTFQPGSFNHCNRATAPLPLIRHENIIFTFNRVVPMWNS